MSKLAEENKRLKVENADLIRALKSLPILHSYSDNARLQKDIYKWLDDPANMALLQKIKYLEK